MRKSDRRNYAFADKPWTVTPREDGKTAASHEARTCAQLQDIRAVLHDLLHEAKETNRMMRELYGLKENPDE